MRFLSICTILCIMLGFGVNCGAGDIYRFYENDEMKIALTFDDGPHWEYTEQILDILAEYGIPATFFVIGENCELRPNIVSRIISDGHEIGNHTYTHDKTWALGKDGLLNELNKTAAAVESACGVHPCLFRPPEGVSNKTVINAAVQMNYSVILWTVDPRDWDKSTTLNSMVNNVLSNVRSGSIILCHDFVSRDTSITPEAIGIIIPKLLEAGYTFVTVSDLINGQ